VFELADSEPKLHGIDAGIGHRESCIGDMDVLERQSCVISANSKRQMNPNSRLRSEIYAAGARRNVVGGEQDTAAKLDKRHGMGRISAEIVLNIERSEAYSIGILARLRENVDGNELNFVLQRSATELKETESIAGPAIEDGSIAGSAAYTVSTLREELEFPRSVTDFLTEKMWK